MTPDEARKALREALALAEALRPFADPSDKSRVQFNRAWACARREAERAAKVYADAVGIESDEVS